MSKYGKKFTCWSCTAKFYDLNKPNPKCPKCGANPEDDPNKGAPAAAAPGFAEDYAEEFEEEVEEDVAAAPDDEDVEEEAEEAPPGDDF
jgi:hypothetical protein